MGNYDDAVRLLQDLEQRQIDDPAITATMAQAYASLAVADTFSRLADSGTRRNQASAVMEVPVTAEGSRAEELSGDPDLIAERIRRITELAREPKREERKQKRRPDLVAERIRRIVTSEQQEQR